MIIQWSVTIDGLFLYNRRIVIWCAYISSLEAKVSINVIQILDYIKLAFIYVNTPRACNMKCSSFLQFNSLNSGQSKRLSGGNSKDFFNAKLFTCTNFKRVEKQSFLSRMSVPTRDGQISFVLTKKSVTMAGISQDMSPNVYWLKARSHGVIFCECDCVFLSHAMGCVDVNDTVHVVWLPWIFACNIAHE